MKKKIITKLYTKLLTALVAIDICMIATLIFSRNSMHDILSMENPEHYLYSSYVCDTDVNYDISFYHDSKGTEKRIRESDGGNQEDCGR